MTNNEIRALLAKAGRAGDTLQIAICNVALGETEWTDPVWLEVNTCLDEYERREMVGYTVESARAECQRVRGAKGDGT